MWRVVLVTGGGSGLGRAAAAELALCGANVVLAGRPEEVLAEAASALGSGVSWTSGDIRHDEDAERIARSCLTRFGRLDLLVNNAGGHYSCPPRPSRASAGRRSSGSTSEAPRG